MKRVVLTGANAGIGKETARGLLNAGCELIMVCRNEEKAQSVQQELRTEFPEATLSYVLADLSEMTQVQAAANTIASQTDSIDILINNAGVMLPDRRTTVDGFEQTFAVNHLSLIHI